MGKLDLKMLHVDVEIFESTRKFCGFKNIRICLDGTLYIDDCHTGEHSQLIDHCRHQHCHIPTAECEQSNVFFSYISAS